MALCFAFGMNLDPSTMNYGGCHEVGPAKLHNWRLVFRGYADVEPCPGETVYGALWELDEWALRQIDRREGFVEGSKHNLYERLTVVCDNGDEQVQAFVYAMSDRTKGYHPTDPPGIGYLSMLLRGYKHFGLHEKALWASVRSACTGAAHFRWLHEQVEKEVAQYA